MASEENVVPAKDVEDPNIPKRLRLSLHWNKLFGVENPDDFTLTLNKLYNAGVLSDGDMERFWEVASNEIYTIDKPSIAEEARKMEIGVLKIHPERLANVFKIIRDFILEDNVREDMKKIEVTSGICGHVFSPGDSAYVCRDCSIDPTCVFCVRCFQNSKHTNHRYKMSTTSGGGCCDCGDNEAWKEFPACTIHEGKIDVNTSNLTPPESSDADEYMKFRELDKLKPETKNRITFMVKCILDFALDVLNFPEDQQEFLQTEYPEDYTFCVVVYNDETHSFDEVTTAISRALGLTEQRVKKIVQQIDTQGRAIISKGNRDHCTNIVTTINDFMLAFGLDALKVFVEKPNCILVQELAIELIGCLNTILDDSRSVRLVCAKTLLYEDDPDDDDGDAKPIDIFYHNIPRMWKSVRASFHTLLFKALLPEYSTKLLFAKNFTDTYSWNLQQFINDDQDYSVSVFALSLQLYTVPSICLHIICNDDALFKLIETLYNEIKNLGIIEQGSIKLDRLQPVLNKKFNKALNVLNDIDYLLGNKPTSWTPQLREYFLRGYKKYLNVLSLMQGMDPIIKCVEAHIEFEQDFHTAYFAVIEMSKVTSKIHEWCGSDKEVIINSIILLLNRLIKRASKDGGEVISVDLYNIKTNCISYNISIKPVSLHLPLTRLFAALYTYTTLQNTELTAIDDFILSLIEPTLRYITLLAEVHSKKWIRNGTGLSTQIEAYCKNDTRKELIDRDIIMLQIAAIFLTPNSFIINLLFKFGLLQWANEKYSPTGDKSEISQTMSMGEECLFILINILFERYVLGVGKVTNEEIIQHDIIQKICIRSMTHSELTKGLDTDNFTLENNVENLVSKVATLQERVKGKKTYFLLPGIEKEFNVFYYRYSREDRNEAERNILKSKKLANAKFICSPPPLPPEFIHPYSKVLRILHSEVLLQLFLVIIKRAKNHKYKFITETQVQQIVYIMGLALLEDERIMLKEDTNVQVNDPLSEYDKPKFFEWCEKQNIVLQLEEIMKNPRPDLKGSVQYVSWFIHEYKRISSTKYGNTADDEEAGNSMHIDLDAPSTSTAALSKEEETRAAKAEKRKAQALEQMKAMQASFMEKNASLLVEVENCEIQNKTPRNEIQNNSVIQKPVAVGIGKTKAEKEETNYTCIVCQDTDNIETMMETKNSTIIVMTCYIQMSTVLENNKSSPEQDYIYKSFDIRDASYYIPAYNISPGPHIQSCGHYMHRHCFDTYYSISANDRDIRRAVLRNTIPGFYPAKIEYMCPLCKNLCNYVLPVLVKPTNTNSEPQQDITTENFFDNLENNFKINSNDKDQAINIHKMLANGRKRVCNEIPKPIWETIDKFFEICQELKSTHRHAIPSIRPTSNSCVLFHLLTYTIRSLEISLRDKPLFGALTTRQEDLLRTLIHVVAMSPYRTECEALLSDIAEMGLKYLFNQNNSLFEFDPLGALFMILFFNTYYSKIEYNKRRDAEIYYFLPDCGVKDNKILHICILINIIIIMLGLGKEPYYKPLINAYLNKCEIKIITENPLFLISIKANCLPFLRCAAIFFRYLSDVKPPEELTVATADPFKEIMNYLGLPSDLHELMNDSIMSRIFRAIKIENYLESMNGDKPASSNYLPEIGDPLKIKTLIQLPNDYSHLVNQVSGYTCVKHLEEVRNPSICLICGNIVPLKNVCCRKTWNETGIGPGMSHAHKCGAGTGLFLRVRSCEIVLLNFPQKGCYVGAPYVDKYGEQDKGLIRGNPLYLHEGMYEELKKNWLSNSLPQVIVRHLDNRDVLLINDWSLM